MDRGGEWLQFPRGFAPHNEILNDPAPGFKGVCRKAVIGSARKGGGTRPKSPEGIGVFS